MSKPQQWVCFNDTHRQCDDSPTLIALPISEPIRLLVHVQLVSLLQWHDNVFNNKQTFELVSISKLQWVCFNGTLNAMIYPPSSLYLSVNLARHRVHVQIVSLLQRRLSSTWWSTYSHRSTYQWIWSNVHVQLVSLLQWHDQCDDLLTLIALPISEPDHTFMCN